LQFVFSSQWSDKSQRQNIPFAKELQEIAALALGRRPPDSGTSEYHEKSTDKLELLDGTTGINTNLDLTIGGITTTLKTFELAFAHNSTIDFATFGKEKVNSDIYLTICRWLADNGHKQFNEYFTDSQ
jgi:hypothetical protein